MMPMMMVSIMRADISGGYEYEYHSKENKLAISTPIAQGLMGKKVGDVAEIKVPSGILKFEIMEISI